MMMKNCSQIEEEKTTKLEMLNAVLTQMFVPIFYVQNFKMSADF